MLTFMIVEPAAGTRSTRKFPCSGGFEFAVLSNAVFLVASIRYARAIHPRLHFGGFFLGIAASLALLFLYTRILR